MWATSKIAVLTLAAATTGGAIATSAQNYPTKPVTVIVGQGPASATDVSLRFVGQEYRAKTGQNWLVENRPGGNLFIAMEACVKAPPDGYTLCMTNSTGMSFNPHVFSRKPYDVDTDLSPVTGMWFVVGGIMARKDIPANSLAELKALAATKKQLNFASLGPGSIPDVLRQWFNREWGADFVDVAYKSGAEIAQALVKGEADVTFIGVGNMATQVQNGDLKIFAIEGSRRSRLLPNVPTFTEAGIGNYPFGDPTWWGLFVPAKTPAPIVKQANEQITAVMSLPSVREFLEKQYLAPVSISGDAFADFVRADRKRAGEVVTKFNIPKHD